MKVDSREFYELMQRYRHAPVGDTRSVLDAFDAVKHWVRANYDHEAAQESDCSTGIGGVTLVQMAENIKHGLDPYAGSPMEPSKMTDGAHADWLAGAQGLIDACAEGKTDDY